MSRIEVLVIGPASSGKTIAAVVIEKALQDAGFKVEPFVTKDGDEQVKREWLAQGNFDEIIPNIEVGIEERGIRGLLK
jgi:nucleoside-triphosphatase THEP1